MVVRIGKTRIEVKAEGCVKCGALWSHRWKKVREVPIEIGSRCGTIEVYICGDCLGEDDKGGDRG